MKNKLLYIGLFLLVICMLWLPLAIACGGTNITEESQTYHIDAGDKRVISIFLEQNDRLDLSLAVNSDLTIQPTIVEPMNIGIMVVNPNGQYVVDYIRVGAGDFMVLAEEGGVYVITLDNSYSSITAKSVSLTMRYPAR